MTKPAAIFVAAAMAVTSACVGVIASFGLGLDFGAALIAAFAALACMAVTQLAFIRAAPKDDGRIDEIDHMLNALQSRLETLEIRLSTLDGGAGERARAATRPLMDEIAALGGLVTSIAKEVAAHDVSIARLGASESEPIAAFLARVAPPAPEPMPPAPAAPSPPVEAAAPSPAASTTVTTASRSPSAELPPAVDRPAFTAPPRFTAPPLTAAAQPKIPASVKIPASPKIPAPEPFDLDEPEGVDSDLGQRIAWALGENRVEPHLQPIVALPSRRTAHYEAFARLAEDDGLLVADQFVDAAAACGLIGEIDRLMAERCAAVALRVSARGGGSVFLNVARETLRDARAIDAIAALVEARGELARLLVPELSQATFMGLAVIERAAVERLAALGVRFSLDEATDLRLDPRELARRGVRFVKVRAAKLLDPESAHAAAIHPADLASLLARHGIDLIATHVEEERTTPELLDMEVRFAQGTLFGSPRPVRPPAPDAEVAPPPPAAERLFVPRSAGAR